MRIALLAPKGDFDKAQGEGTLRYMYEIYRNMKKIESEYSSHVEKVELPIKKYLNKRLSFALGNFFANLSEFDIAHSLTLMPMQNLRSRNTIKFMTIHDFQFLLEPELSSDMKKSWTRRIWWSRTFLRIPMKISLQSVDYIMVNSTQTKDETIAMGFPEERIFVANHGMDERFINTPLPKRSRRGKFRVGYIGAFRKRKNVWFAVDAFMGVPDKDITFELWGPPKFEYNNIKERAKSDKRIAFKGFAPEENLVKTYDSFDLFVFPSMYEGEGLAILEAQARGLPVIIYKHGKIPKEIRRYCFEAEDSRKMAEIIGMIKKRGYDKKRRAQAMRYARTFTWERTARETLKVYKFAMEQRK
ncbi:MAG: glycosyltransferase [Candidatus Micrarchaeales archaeon]|nr:glycosyltransferase [Candidatus Micrarchaeales archaeon]